MPVRKDIPYNEGLFFITFTCYKWLPLIEQTNGYDLVYGWFDYLEESFDWKICETAEFAYQKLIYMHNNPCRGKWNLAEDITKYEYSSARYYITGKHAGYVVKDIEAIYSERYAAEELFKDEVKVKVVDEKGQMSS